MGTRHLTAVYFEGEYKIAQYGQWDGYPEGQGLTVLEFVHRLKDEDTLEHFKRNLRNCRWITADEEKALDERIRSGKIRNWEKVYPQFDRDTGAKILDFVLSSTGNIVLENEFEFAFDGLYCEYIWCIDLDDDVFGLYGSDGNSKTLYQRTTWKIEDAPSKDEFLAAFE